MKKPEIIFKTLIIISLFSISIILLYTFVLSKNNTVINNNEINKDVNRIDETKLIEDKLNDFIKQTINKSPKIIDFYADTLKYFNITNAKKEDVLKDKNDFFKKWDVIKIIISNIQINKNEDNSYTCLFDKELNNSNKDNSYYKGKVKGNIKFANINSLWKIVNETDDEIYFTDKSKSLKEFIEEFRKEVPKSKDYYMEHTESPLISVVTDSPEKVTASSVYESIKNILKFKYAIKNNIVIFNEFTYEYTTKGDVLSHAFYFKKDINGKWMLFKIIWAGC